MSQKKGKQIILNLKGIKLELKGRLFDLSRGQRYYCCFLITYSNTELLL